jgi:hypothetical protein
MCQLTRNVILIPYNTVYNTDVIFVHCFGHINLLSVLSYTAFISKNFQSICKCKGTVHPITGHECPEGEYRYSSTLSVSLATDEGGRSRSHPSCCTPEKRPNTHCTRCWVGPRASLDRCRKPCPHWDSIPAPSSP